MQTIYSQDLSNGQTVNVIDIGHDITYARGCFDGSDIEWSEILQDSGNALEPDRIHFYIVSLGMPGYMADSVSVYTDRKSALAGAKFWEDSDAEMLADEEEV